MRVFVRLLASLFSLALAAVGALLAVEVAWHWWRPESTLLIPWSSWRDTLTKTQWDSSAVRIIAWIVLAVGLVAIIACLSARVKAIKLADPDEQISVSTSPRSLARLVGQRVRAQENISGASVIASKKKIRVRAQSALASENELRPQLLETVTAVLEDVPLIRQPRVSVVVDSPKDR